MSYVNCKHVVKAYRLEKREIVALRGIDFQMEAGESVTIVGPSGAGKSSLLNLLGGLDRPTAGQLTVGAQNLLELKGRKLAHYRLQQVGFVWQEVSRNLLFHRSALHNVTLPMMLAGVSYRERMRRGRELLEAVGLHEHWKKRPAQLSGGQQQRVAIAVALANNPALLLADEPTGALDRQSSMQVMALINDLRQKFGLTLLMVTHNMEVAALTDRVLTLRDGALGQDLSQTDEQKLDEEGRIQLPTAARSTLNAARIAIEIRPEGVLLRPEEDAIEEKIELQDAPPEKRSWFRRKKKGAA